MDTPIIICGKGTIDCFQSVEDAEAYLEPIDVRNNEYVAYNDRGEKLQIDICMVKKCLLFGLFATEVERVKIGYPINKNPSDVSELRAVLIGFFKKTGCPSEAIVHLSIDELIAETINRFCKSLLL